MQWILQNDSFDFNPEFPDKLAIFLKAEACGQKVLPDRPIMIGQKLVENAKMEKFKWDILRNFQSFCPGAD